MSRQIFKLSLLRVFLAFIVAAAIGLSVFWWLTIPAAISADMLPAYTPNLANGLTTFNAGGCSSCHGPLFLETQFSR